MSLRDEIRRLEQDSQKKLQEATEKERKNQEGQEILKNSLESIRQEIEQALQQNGFCRPMVWDINGTTYKHEKFPVSIQVRFEVNQGLKIHVTYDQTKRGHISVSKSLDGELIFQASVQPPSAIHRQISKAIDAFFH